MLINFSQLLEKYDIKPKGVIHIGASTGQEFHEYQKNNIKHQLWIEAIPSVFEELKKTIESNPDAVAINACISDEDDKEVEFKITGINNGESSSFLEMGTHLYLHSNVLVTETIKMKTRTVDEIFSQIKRLGLSSRSGAQVIDTNYDFLNLDLQGCEIYAIRGMKDFLRNVNFIYSEVNATEVYRGNMLLPDFDNYLLQHGFERVELKWGVENHWGDALYLRTSPSVRVESSSKKEISLELFYNLIESHLALYNHTCVDGMQLSMNDVADYIMRNNKKTNI